MEFKDKLLELRKSHHLSQQQLADQLNVSRQSISKWELGESQPDLHNLVRLSEIFQISTDYLLKDEFNNSENEKKSSIFLVIGSLVILMGALVGYMLHKYYGNSLAYMVGIVIQILGCILFEYFALKEQDQKAQKTFFSINIWLLWLLPIQYFSQNTRTYQLIEKYLWSLDIGKTVIGSLFIVCFPLFISLVLSFICFLLIRKLY